MKKYIAILALLLVCRVGYSQEYNVDRLFKEFSRTKSSERVKLGKIFMSFAGMFTETMGINEIEVYDFDGCEEEVKRKLTNAIRSLKDPRFETLISANEGGDRTKILIRIKGDFIREIIMVSTGDSNALVRLKGKIKPSDFEKVAIKHGKGGC
jgi:hypothetical protein